MTKNPNHPKPGSIIKVEPIRKLADIKKIRTLLKGNSRDKTIFDVAINTNLRISDLVRLKVGRVRQLQPGETLVLREKKTGKTRSITLNRTCYQSIQVLLADKDMEDATDDDFLFRSRKGKKGLLPNTLNGLVRKWTENLGLKGNYGSHSLRKTFGYIHRTVLGTDIPTLMKLFNHSTQRQTLDYLCIQPEEIRDAYMKEI